MIRDPFSRSCSSSFCSKSVVCGFVQYWDIATLDIYEGYTKEKYEIMMNISNGKPLGIGECWVVPSPGRLEAEPSWAFFMSWSELTFKLPNTGVSL